MEYVEQNCKLQEILFVFLGKVFNLGILAFARMNNKKNLDYLTAIPSTVSFNF